jgi:hypothetical protein
MKQAVVLRKGDNHFTEGFMTPGHKEVIVDNIGRCECGFKKKYLSYYELSEEKFNPQGHRVPPYFIEIQNRHGMVTIR